MVTVKYGKNCNLCGLPVEIKGFTLETEKGQLTFCCAGCQSIYQLIYANKQAQKIENKSDNHEEN